MVTVKPTVISRAEHALRILSKEAIIEGAYLFGSQVKGNTHEWSDIDIAAFVHHAESWGIIARAKKMAKVQKEAGDDIELHFFPADQFSHPEPSSFAEYIQKTGIRLEVPDLVDQPKE
jgi:predicted nucleotidyltransferase